MISSAIDQEKMQYMPYSETMDAEKFVEFQKRPFRSYNWKLYAILDNLRVYHSKTVKQWGEENKDRIALFFLPSYSRGWTWTSISAVT